MERGGHLTWTCHWRVEFLAVRRRTSFIHPCICTAPRMVPVSIHHDFDVVSRMLWVASALIIPRQVNSKKSLKIRFNSGEDTRLLCLFPL